jgi:hypothetical protein
MLQRAIDARQSLSSRDEFARAEILGKRQCLMIRNALGIEGQNAA